MQGHIGGLNRGLNRGARQTGAAWGTWGKSRCRGTPSASAQCTWPYVTGLDTMSSARKARPTLPPPPLLLLLLLLLVLLLLLLPTVEVVLLLLLLLSLPSASGSSSTQACQHDCTMSCATHMHTHTLRQEKGPISERARRERVSTQVGGGWLVASALHACVRARLTWTMDRFCGY